MASQRVREAFGRPGAPLSMNMAKPDLQCAIRDYWNERIHDLEVATSPVGSAEFFRELDTYRFEKLHYLPELVDFASFGGRKVLEVGCGAGIDLLRFARGGARVTGVDLSSRAIELAQQNFAQAGLRAQLMVMDGEVLGFADNSFDVVYAHGVLQYTGDAVQMVRELHRVLRSGGQAILMVYNRRSWLTLMSKVGAVALEHEDAPAFRLFTIDEFRQTLRPFSEVQIIPERFPVHTRLQKGVKALAYNGLFVPAFNLLPRALVRSLGWHLMAFTTKAA